MTKIIVILLLFSCSHKTWDGKYFWYTPDKIKLEPHKHSAKEDDIKGPHYIPNGHKQHEIVHRYYLLYHYRYPGQHRKFKKEK